MAMGYAQFVMVQCGLEEILTLHHYTEIEMRMAAVNQDAMLVVDLVRINHVTEISLVDVTTQI